uniref:Peptidase C1A papain C-terminal domain-containing protein n=1 Tax=Chromera velia CCMP2878 TaxID=1169474 RepID=A0A0G4IFW9_9ALVE|eukprot:Cvel_14020.t1-p1 / transcript=Cvel_14020.t1 / gene=Cvel_14020 / organism=Chromera_velia_CCMP2878 / gene_product=Oryzain alpha chain, putative / transcript_product=Oryzain alpha chain, putative / location=Cvel_scaffold981:51201-52529(-) / protein_length=443 / sequence_SO=supercontig / SO=protein_coding / is_pseudo=false
MTDKRDLTDLEKAATPPETDSSQVYSKGLPSKTPSEYTDAETNADEGVVQKPRGPVKEKNRVCCTPIRRYSRLFFGLAALVFLIVVLVAVGVNLKARSDSEASIDKAFAEHMKKHGKTYKGEERDRRRAAFGTNFNKAMKHNVAANSKHTLSTGGPFADLTQEEFLNKHVPKRKKDDSTYSTNYHPKHKLNDEARVNDLFAKKMIPDEVDRRTQGCVAPVKNQGDCGSCWTFATADALYSFHCRNQGQDNAVLLSTQQLVDCASGDGCMGGLPGNAFDYVSKSGLCSNADYPYTSGQSDEAGSCRSSECLPVVLPSSEAGYYAVPPNSEKALQVAVYYHQTVAVSMDAENLQDLHLYSGGVYDGFVKGSGGTCGSERDHAVLVVGYGVEEKSGTPYWLIKNSWGTHWGEDGYFKLLRGKNEHTLNDCDVLARPLYPSKTEHDD